MASKVIEFRRPGWPTEPSSLIDTVTIRERSDILKAAKVLAKAADDREMRVMALHDISSEQPMVDAEGTELNSSVFGWDPDSYGLWNEVERASRSQIVRACRVEGEPFWVNRNGFWTGRENPFIKGITLDDFEERSSFGAAIVIPVHLPFGRIAAAVLSSTDCSKDDLAREFAQFGTLLTDLCRRFLTSYVGCMRDNPYLPYPEVLTKREVECIRWAAFGKTDNEISIILDRSHATVRYRIKRVCDKLGAANRAQAVFRACQLGYLGSVA
jgi:DNA-binding CsgD family transcriptional regulator